MRTLFLVLVFLAICSPVFGADVDSPIGTWKLVSWQVILENGPPQDVFGSHPEGFLILTGDGRMIVLTTAEKRKGGMGDHERAALHKSMVAYYGCILWLHIVVGTACRDMTSSQSSMSHGMKSGMVPSRNAISELKATSSS